MIISSIIRLVEKILQINKVEYKELIHPNISSFFASLYSSFLKKKTFSSHDFLHIVERYEDCFNDEGLIIMMNNFDSLFPKERHFSTDKEGIAKSTFFLFPHEKTALDYGYTKYTFSVILESTNHFGVPIQTHRELVCCYLDANNKIYFLNLPNKNPKST